MGDVDENGIYAVGVDVISNKVAVRVHSGCTKKADKALMKDEYVFSVMGIVEITETETKGGDMQEVVAVKGGAEIKVDGGYC